MLLSSRPAALRGVVQHYAWGSPTAIPALLGEPEDGRPWAELWLGTHPSGPADVVVDGAAVPLPELLESEGQPPLPFLLKALAADAALSLQAHPTLEQAREGFAREDAEGIDRAAPHRNYQDANHKPELVVALTPFRALAGLRDPAVTLRVVDTLGAAVGEAFAPLRDDPTGSGAVTALCSLLNKPADEGAALVESALAAAQPGHPDPEVAKAADLLGVLAKEHPGDVGALVALLLNDVTLAPGEALFMQAGFLHAYVSGFAVEIMAASDNVLRGGLTPKHVDIDELARVLVPETGAATCVPERPEAPGLVSWPVPVDDFLLARAVVDGGPVALPADRGPGILLVVEGSVEVDGLTVRRGQSAFLPAGGELRGSGICFLATAGK